MGSAGEVAGLGFLQLDEKAQKGEYQLSLPIRPEGELTTWTATASRIRACQIFAVV